MGTKGTANHVYFVDEVLGVGSSATVYVGRNKKTGQLCAMKVYSDLNSDLSREFQTMQLLNHENVIKFIAVESESASKGKVLIMELSTGGSVLNMLEKPEFAFGFSEDEFLVFLRDMTSALRYLRENKIVHRDIKPGNILRFVKEDMSSQFKITDFGAARELDDSDQFLSIYGTEEYLEPTAYRQALLSNRRSVSSFNASVDLWSLGVTLYHVATGQLPFQSFGGRKNKEDMYAITSKKQSGVISGVQRELDGPIEWSEDLPETCSLSRGLKRRLKKILSNLLECDARRRWSFEKFFKHSVDITSRKALQVVLVCEFTVSRFYAAPEDLESFSSFKSFLQSEAKLFSASSVLFCHPHLSLEEIFMESADSSAPRLHIYVIPASPDECTWKSFRPEHPLKIPEAPNANTMSWDSTFAIKSLAFVSFLERKCDDIIHLVEHLETFFHSSWKDLIGEVKRINELNEILKPNAGMRKFTFSTLSQKEGVKIKPITENGHLEEKSNPESPNQIKKAPENQLELSWMMCSQTTKSWEIHSAFQSGPLFCIEELLKEKRKFYNSLNIFRERMTMLEKRKFVKIGDDLKEIVQKFQKQAELEKKDQSRLTHNELQIHKFDKKRITKLTLNAEKLHKAISSHMADFCHSFKSWFKLHSQMKGMLMDSCSSLALSTISNFQVGGFKQPPHTSLEPFGDLENSILEQLDNTRMQEETLKAFVKEQSEQVKKLQNIFICMS